MGPRPEERTECQYEAQTHIEISWRHDRVATLGYPHRPHAGPSSPSILGPKGGPGSRQPEVMDSPANQTRPRYGIWASPRYTQPTVLCSKANLGTRIAAEAAAQVDVLGGGGSAGLREEGEQGEQRDRRDLWHDSRKTEIVTAGDNGVCKGL